MAIFLGSLLLIALIVLIGAGVLMAYLIYFAALVVGGAALFLIVMFCLGISNASQQGDFTILGVALFLSAIAAWLIRVAMKNAEAEERREAERKAKELAAKQAREEAEYRLRATR